MGTLNNKIQLKKLPKKMKISIFFILTIYIQNAMAEGPKTPTSLWDLAITKSHHSAPESKSDIHGIWFYEQANCKKLFNTISQVIDRIKKGNPGNKDNITSNPKMNNAVRSEGQTLADLLSNAGNKEKTHQEPKIKSSPSSGEKLLRLLSNQPGSKGED